MSPTVSGRVAERSAFMRTVFVFLVCLACALLVSGDDAADEARERRRQVAELKAQRAETQRAIDEREAQLEQLRARRTEDQHALREMHRQHHDVPRTTHGRDKDGHRKVAKQIKEELSARRLGMTQIEQEISRVEGSVRQLAELIGDANKKLAELEPRDEL